MQTLSVVFWSVLGYLPTVVIIIFLGLVVYNRVRKRFFKEDNNYALRVLNGWAGGFFSGLMLMLLMSLFAIASAFSAKSSPFRDLVVVSPVIVIPLLISFLKRQSHPQFSRGMAVCAVSLGTVIIIAIVAANIGF